MKILTNRGRAWGKSRESAMNMIEALRSGYQLMVASPEQTGWHVIRSFQELRACSCEQCKLAFKIHEGPAYTCQS